MDRKNFKQFIIAAFYDTLVKLCTCSWLLSVPGIILLTAASVYQVFSQPVLVQTPGNNEQQNQLKYDTIYMKKVILFKFLNIMIKVM